MSTTAATKPKPIIFTGESVKAILAGTKTQTRRVIPHNARGADRDTDRRRPERNLPHDGSGGHLRVEDEEGRSTMSTPKRIQLSRKEGWRMPPNTVSVTRPGKWGNPFPVGSLHPWNGKLLRTAEESVKTFRQWLNEFEAGQNLARQIPQLRGKNLACWCKPGEPCHADVLLEIANA